MAECTPTNAPCSLQILQERKKLHYLSHIIATEKFLSAQILLSNDFLFCGNMRGT